MDSKNYYFDLIKDLPFDDNTKVLLMQSYCVGYADGKKIAFEEAIAIISNPNKTND